MMIYNLIFILAFLSFSGCSCVPVEKPKSVVVTTEIKEVYIETGCIKTDVKCDLSGNGFVPTQKLLECIILQKRALEACSKTSKQQH